MRLLYCCCFFALSFSAAQTPKDTAWNAYNAAKQNRRDLIPALAALVEAYSPITLESGSVPPETAAIEAVADALIQLQAKLLAANRHASIPATARANHHPANARD